MTDKAEIQEWFERGMANGDRWMLVICDTFDHTDYPSFFQTSQLTEMLKRLEKVRSGESMEKLMEVYDLSSDMTAQLDMARAMSIPYFDTLPNDNKSRDTENQQEIQVYDG